jgi:hypothetical protein
MRLMYSDIPNVIKFKNNIKNKRAAGKKYFLIRK